MCSLVKSLCCSAVMLFARTGCATADVVTLPAVVDAFVASSLPDGNFGGAGSLAVASPSLMRGEFQALLRFDVGPAATAFDAAFGAGQWQVVSAELRLTATPPANPLFNPQSAGMFVITWMENDSWVEGTGMPSTPGTVGVTYNSLPSFLSPMDQSLGEFAFDGSTSGAIAYGLALGVRFHEDVRAGGLLSLRRLSKATRPPRISSTRGTFRPWGIVRL